MSFYVTSSGTHFKQFEFTALKQAFQMDWVNMDFFKMKNSFVKKHLINNVVHVASGVTNYFVCKVSDDVSDDFGTIVRKVCVQLLEGGS